MDRQLKQTALPYRWGRAAALALIALWAGLAPCAADSLTLMGVGGAGNYLLSLIPNATVAYSTRRISPGYAGKDMNVRRGSDNAQSDIGFIGGDLDTPTAASFCADGTVYLYIGGSITTGDKLTITFANSGISGSPVSVSYTTVGGDTTTTAATGLKAAINASTPLSSAGILATSSGAVVTISYSVSTTPLLYPTTGLNAGATELQIVASDCYVDTWYDQSGAAINATDSTAGDQPQLALSASPTRRACLLFQGGTKYLLSASSITLNTPFSGSAVAERTGAFTTEGLVWGANSGLGLAQLDFNSTANQAFIYAGNFVTTSQTDSELHVLGTLFNSGTSEIIVDGTVLAGDSGTHSFGTQTLAIGYNQAFAAQPHTGLICEIPIWDFGLSSTQFSGAQANQQNYYGMP